MYLPPRRDHHEVLRTQDLSRTGAAGPSAAAEDHRDAVLAHEAGDPLGPLHAAVDLPGAAVEVEHVEGQRRAVIGRHAADQRSVHVLERGTDTDQPLAGSITGRGPSSSTCQLKSSQTPRSAAARMSTDRSRETRPSTSTSRQSAARRQPRIGESLCWTSPAVRTDGSRRRRGVRGPPSPRSALWCR